MTEQDLVLFLNQKLIEIAGAMMEFYSPCDLHGSACRAGDPNPCCVNSQYGPGLCPFWRERCTFLNCDCRLWICGTAAAAVDPKCVEALKLLEQFGRLYGLVREPLIGDPYIGADRQNG